jgi:hypothetical protein
MLLEELQLGHFEFIPVSNGQWANDDELMRSREMRPLV